MTHVTCRLTAKNRDQLGNRVWATFTFFTIQITVLKSNSNTFLDYVSYERLNSEYKYWKVTKMLITLNFEL